MLDNYGVVLTTEEACEVLRIGCNSLYKLLRLNQLKGYKNGRVWRIPKQAIKDYIITSSNLN